MSPAGLVLCGGRSARMARDKALLPWGETDLLGHAVARLQAVVSEVALLSGPEPRYADRGLPIVTDGDTEGGPIAGLAAGLEHAAGLERASGVEQGASLDHVAGKAVGPAAPPPEGRPVLLLAVDLPLVPVSLLRALADGLAYADAVVPASPQGLEPLCAAYAPACLPAIRSRLAAGERKMSAFWPDVRVRLLRPDELRVLGDPETMFLNVNEETDLARAREAWRRS